MRNSFLNTFSFLILLIITSPALSAYNYNNFFPDASLQDMLEWGTFKVQRIHAITQRTDPRDSLTFSMLIGRDLELKATAHIYQSFRDLTNSIPRNKAYYEEHNGFYYAKQKATAWWTGANLTSTFFKTNVSSTRQAWSTITDVTNYGMSPRGYVTLFYTIALENFNNDGQGYLTFDPNTKKIKYSGIAADGSTFENYISYHVYQDGRLDDTTGVEMHYETVSGLNQTNLWQLDSIIKSKLQFAGGVKPKYATLHDSVDPDIKNTKLVLLQFRVPVKAGISIMFSYDTMDYPQSLDWPGVQALLTSYHNDFMTQFDATFPNVGGEYRDLGVYAISNLLGGINYNYGPIYIVQDPTPQPAMGILTGTPSRNAFMHGYLWDEGFHEMTIYKWSAELSLELISSWMKTQYKNGWIPREQIRGPEITSFTGDPWIVQNLLEGNPPALMMTVHEILRDDKVDERLKQRIYTELKDPLYKWWDWFYNFQQVYDDSHVGLNLFLWHLKNEGGVFGYLGSGLDDYPRFDPGFISKYHLDLHVWVQMFADIMGKISQGAGDTANQTYFEGLGRTLQNNLKVFVDPTDGVYKDVFQPNTTTKDSKISLPSPHIGYVSLMPMLFGYLEPGSEGLERTLDLIDNTARGDMYTDYGIMSLRWKDGLFEKNSNYWCGPIWINFNFLTLRALKLFYWDNPRAERIYNTLRSNILQLMNFNFNENHYIWEHYNIHNGRGEGDHPFTGWSTVIVWIISENYGVDHRLLPPLTMNNEIKKSGTNMRGAAI